MFPKAGVSAGNQIGDLIEIREYVLAQHCYMAVYKLLLAKVKERLYVILCYILRGGERGRKGERPRQTERDQLGAFPI